MHILQKELLTNQDLPGLDASAANDEFRATFGCIPGGIDIGECKKWQRLCESLIEERQRLREQLVQAQVERDNYLKSLYAATRKEYHFTKEEVLAQCGGEPTLQQLVAELEMEEAQKQFDARSA